MTQIEASHVVLDGDDTPRRMPIIAIGASTGGPPALATILTEFPADLRAAFENDEVLDTVLLQPNRRSDSCETSTDDRH